MKAHKSARQAACRRTCAFNPGPALVPEKVVQNSSFHCDHRRSQVIETGSAFECREYRQLNADSDKTDRIEFHPNAERSGHGIRSSRYNRMVLRIDEYTA